MSTNWRDVPVPDRLARLAKDKRGYPIFFIATVLPDGSPAFTVTDPKKLMRCIKGDLCSLCGTKLHRGRWFVGGPFSALHHAGSYADPPMHHECMRYAMQVCPYLAAPSWTNDLSAHGAAKAVEAGIPTVRLQSIIERPYLFICVMSIGHTVRSANNGLTLLFLPADRKNMEYWRHGVQLSEIEGAEKAMEILAAGVPEQRQGSLMLPIKKET